jgi:flagellin
LTKKGQEKKMAVINTNVKALFSQMALKTSGQAQSTAMQQLSTGKRINSARDDAAGMAIATRMTHQIRSLNQAVRNAGDAISLIQTAEGATNEITDMLQRMRELAVQAVNDTNDNAQRSYLDLEFQQLKQQIVQIADNTEWNGFPLLSGKAGQQVGEMPVYKATSQNLTGQVFIDPTTTRTIEGGGVGEQQKIMFDSATLPGSLSGTRTLTIGATDTQPGVQVPIDANDITSVGALNTKIKEYLDKSPQFGPGSGRKVELADTNAVNDTLVITYAATDGDAIDTKFDDGASGIKVGSLTTTQNAVTQTHEQFDNNGKFLLSGAMTISKTGVDANGDGKEDVAASFLTSDNKTIEMLGEFDAAKGTVSFNVNAGANKKVISDNLTYTLQDSKGVPFDANTNALDMSGREMKLTVDVSGSIPPLRSGDLMINGVDIGGSYASDDPLSPVNNASGSAIAKAAAINRKAAASGISQGQTQTLTFSGVPTPGTITVGGVSVTLTNAENTAVLATAKIAATLRASAQFGPDSGRNISYASGGSVINFNFPAKEGDVDKVQVLAGQTSLSSVADISVPYSSSQPGTGVFAKVNENVFTGKAMSGSSVVSGAVFINGYASANINTVLNNPRETRINVVNAINLISDKTGVKAIDTGSDAQGVTLVAADGRNIEVRFETDSNAGVFGDRIGMKEGVQSSTISLESKIPAAVVLSSSATGDIGRVGLVAGNFTKNQSVYNTVARPEVGPAVAQVSKVNVSVDPVAGLTAGDKLTVVINGTAYSTAAAAGTEKTQDMRDALISAINDPDVTVTKGTSLGELLITAKVPGVPFTVASSKTLDASSVATITSDTVVKSQQPDIKMLGKDDLVINGIAIRPTTSADDLLSNTVSTSSNRAASAIALAAAINASTPETGVRAEANPVVINGSKTVTSNTSAIINGKLVETDAPIGMQSLYLNGIKVEVDFKLNEDPVDRRMKVVNAINERTGQHGIVAEDNGKGVTLKSDGRNVSVWFDSNVGGLSAASFGLDGGNSVAQVNKITLGGTVSTGDKISVVVNGQTIEATTTGNTPGQAAIDLAAKINATPGLTNLVADVDPDDPSAVLLTSKVPGSPMDLRGATVVPASSGATVNIATVHDNSPGGTQITGIRNATATSNSARTLYGTVRMIGVAADLPVTPGVDGRTNSLVGTSGKPITISTGADGFGPQSNFADLGFQVGSFGGRSSEDMDPPRVGRLAFQVGSSANQLVTIDLADFGKNGPITGEITGDVDLAVDKRSVRINTGAGATAVLNLLDIAMDKVNATRATMGAVMNRLDHVINNLTNVSMNMSASRSQIEDSDYASASTELAKTQIMQQAATAVLAQANTSQQTVLKLLGG